jgi:hypothetical protein
MLWNDYAAAVGIEEDLGRIKPHAPCGLERPVHAVAAELAGRQAGDKHMPVVVSAIDGRIQADHATGLGLIVMVEQQQFDPGGML